MSAILKDVSVLADTDTPGTVSANITVNFNPDPTLPPNKRFTFSSGDVVGNVFRVADDVTTVNVQLTLTSLDQTAKFASSPVVFGIPPPGLTAPQAPTLTNQGKTLAFTFLAPPNSFVPPHFFTPWAFQLSINGTIGTTAVNGMATPTFFISRNPNGLNSQSVNLVYNSTDGSFTIDDSVPLGQTPLLTNTVFPLDVAVTLEGAAGFPGSDLTQAILWNSGEQPDWISPAPGNPAILGANMNFTIAGDGKGQGAGFRFAVNLSSNGPMISSPDPILVNATIGDGG